MKIKNNYFKIIFDIRCYFVAKNKFRIHFKLTLQLKKSLRMNT